MLKELREDASLSTLASAFIALLVGLTSSAVLVFQAASTVGLSPSEASSWLGSLCVGMGILSVVLSLRYRAPILIAWSTPGAAILVAGLHSVPLSDAVGAFLLSAVLIFLCGVTGLFEKVMRKIPIALAQALLAGVLLHFCLEAFVGIKTQALIVLSMFASYLLARKLCPRYTMLVVLLVGTVMAATNGLLHFENVRVGMAQFKFTAPTFSPSILLGIGVPLFIVTMASQNLTGITVIRANGYQTPFSPLLVWTGVMNVLTAPFGGFAINLAAITAAIAMGPESHHDPKKRYVAGVLSGLMYAVVGLFAATVTGLFSAFPQEMVMGIAGLALMGTVASSLQGALAHESDREAAFITFAVTASGLSLFSIGSAFWGLVAGVMAQFILRVGKRN